MGSLIKIKEVKGGRLHLLKRYIFLRVISEPNFKEEISSYKFIIHKSLGCRSRKTHHKQDLYNKTSKSTEPKILLRFNTE